MNQEVRLEKIEETYLIKEINQNELMNKNYKKVCRVLNYIDYLFIMISTITGCVSISDFDSLVGIPIGVASSAMGFKICPIAGWIKKNNSIIKKNRKKYNKVALSTKSKLNNIEVLTPKTLIGSIISHNEF